MKRKQTGEDIILADTKQGEDGAREEIRAKFEQT